MQSVKGLKEIFLKKTEFFFTKLRFFRHLFRFDSFLIENASSKAAYGRDVSYMPPLFLFFLFYFPLN